jgi:hypothetical protein
MGDSDSAISVDFCGLPIQVYSTIPLVMYILNKSLLKVSHRPVYLTNLPQNPALQLLFFLICSTQDLCNGMCLGLTVLSDDVLERHGDVDHETGSPRRTFGVLGVGLVGIVGGSG